MTNAIAHDRPILQIFHRSNLHADCQLGRQS